jgi:tRNA (guanine-N7-)-methyltransferase
MSDDVLAQGWSRSYRRKQGQPTRAQRAALRELAPRYLLDASYGVTLDLPAAFGRRGRVVLEVGFGMGENLVAQAERLRDQQVDLVGVEVHTPGLGAAMLALDERGLTNARVVRRDVIELLGRHVPDASFDEVWIFFPEPWPREKDVHRRLMRPELLDLLARRMRPGGELRLATDVRAYAEYALGVLSDHPRFANLAASADGFAERPEWRPLTKYEARGLEQGRAAHDLWFGLTEA